MKNLNELTLIPLNPDQLFNERPQMFCLYLLWIRQGFIKNMVKDYLYDLQEEGANKELVEETHNKLFTSRGLRLGTLMELNEEQRKMVLDKMSRKDIVKAMKEMAK